MPELLDATKGSDGQFRLESNMLLRMQDQEIDRQISTAKKFPRVTSRVISEIQQYATENDDAAQECVYALPRAGKVIVGPTARFAEIVATSWGNSSYAARIIDENEAFVVAQAVFHDLEKNIRISIEVPRRIVDSNGKRYNVDMIGVTSAAAMSIAMRNAILKGVPKSVWGPAYDKALSLIKGTFETIEARRTAALKHFAKLGVAEALVLQMLGKEKVRDIEPDDIIVLRGTLQAIKDGDTTVNRLFGNMEQKPKGEGNKADVSGHLQKGKEKANGKKAAGKQEDGKSSADQNGKADPAADQNADRESGTDGISGAGGEGGGADNGRDSAAGHGVETGEHDAAPDDAEASAEGEVVKEEIDQSHLPENPRGSAWPDGEASKLNSLRIALSQATTAPQVSTVASEFLPVFESTSSECEQAYSDMVSARRREVRGSARDKL